MIAVMARARSKRWMGDALARLVLLALVWIAFTALSTSFASSAIVFSVLQASAPVGLIALGLGVAMIAGELDLSVASIAAVAGVLAVKMSGLGLIPGIAIATLCGCAFGAVQGACIAKLRINSVVFTIGTLFALRGVAYLLTNSKSVLLPLAKLGPAEEIIERLGVFSPYSLVAIGVMAAVGIGLGIHRWGREIYAIGGARAESAAAGVAQLRPIIIAFGLSGLTAGLAGAMSSIVQGSGSAEAFSSYLLLAITAVLVGGVGLYGGRGTIFNIVVGTVILESFIAGLINQGASGNVQQLATGGLLLLVVIVEFASGMAQGGPEGRPRLPRWARFNSWRGVGTRVRERDAV